jgi:hypothetical protein
MGILYSKSCVLTGRASAATAQVGCKDDMVNERVIHYIDIKYSKSCVLTGRAGGATAQVGCKDEKANKRVILYTGI